MRFLLLTFMLTTSFTLFAQEGVSLKNDREGKSFHQSRSIRKSQERALNGLNSTEIVSSFNAMVASMNDRNLCSFHLNARFKSKLTRINPGFKELKGALYHLRAKNEIDDIALKILLKAHEVENFSLDLPKYTEKLIFPEDEVKLSEMMKVMNGTQAKLRTGCLDEVYRGLASELFGIDKHIKSYHIEAILVRAYEQKFINVRTYLALEKARASKLSELALDLKAYYKKIKSLRTHFPLRDGSEKSDFATNKFRKLKVSRRQHLIENYSDLQIMLMGNVIKKLRSRLEAPKVEILVYSRDAVDEVITLEPMERFRFAIKVLRKEMGNLALNTYFNGNTPDYLDLMTAAYETGIIPAVELDEIAGLQDIWNPKKSFWEKAKVWVSAFGSVAAVIIPPPYGFLPALGLVVIEATVGKKQISKDETSLF